MVQGAAAGVVILRRLDHQPVRHSVMGTVVIAVARVVAFPEPGQGLSQDLPAVILGGGGMDDDQVQIGLLIPAAGGPGAEEDDGLRVGLGRQVPAEIDCGRIGIPGGSRPASPCRCGVVSPAARDGLQPAGAPVAMDLVVVDDGGHGMISGRLVKGAISAGERCAIKPLSRSVNSFQTLRKSP